MTLAPGGCAFVVKEMFSRGIQDRSGEEQIGDAWIDAVFSRKVGKINGDLIYDVNVDVWRGRVMLTGVVEDPRLLDTLSRLAEEDRRAKAVYNEVRIVPKREKEFSEATLPLTRKIRDFLIEMDIKTKFFSDDDVSSVNYHLRAVLGRVYVIGRSRSAGERRHLLRLIRKTRGVKGLTEVLEVAPPVRSAPTAALPAIQ